MKMQVLGCKLHRVHLVPILWKDTREQVILDAFLFGETRLLTENKDYYCYLRTWEIISVFWVLLILSDMSGQ